MNRVTVASLLTITLLWAAAVGRGDESKPATDTPTKPKAAGKDHAKGDRLPPYFAKIVSPEQREAIYKIDEDYMPKIKDLQKQLEDLRAEESAKIRAVLTPEQQKQLDDAVAEHKAAKSGKPTKPTGDASSAKPDKPKANARRRRRASSAGCHRF